MIAELTWWMIALSFFFIAALYASVGFGGGSSYTALLAIAGLPVLWIPVLSLSCNLIVVVGGCWHFQRQGYLNRPLITPFLISSIPAAFLAGKIPVDAAVYIPVLAISLLAAASMLILRPNKDDKPLRPCPVPLRLFAGALLGGLSGLVGIGGGIFLAPMLMLCRWASPKESAGAASVFILVNSLSGLAGQLTKPDVSNALPLLPLLAGAVFAGGQIGSRWGSGILSPLRIRQITAVLMAVVATRLLIQPL